jgi:hypothetical protein
MVMIEANAFRSFISVYFVLQSERLSATIKLTLDKTLIRSSMTYDCPACEFSADNHLWKLQHLQKKILCTICKFPSCI